MLACRPAFGNANAGWVEYEAGHSLNGTAANVGAIRAFFDFFLQAGIAHTPQFTASSIPSTMTAGSTAPVTATIPTELVGFIVPVQCDSDSPPQAAAQ